MHSDEAVQKRKTTFQISLALVRTEKNWFKKAFSFNLVKLLGYCWEENELLLVYEFMPKGSLEEHLYGRGSAVQPLPWAIRLNILIGAARGLDFLHTSEEQVIYRDFKPSNILLDESYNAKILDFGLAKFGPSGSTTHLTTRVMGTHGYAAPEYVATGHLYVKSDMYGFGVVLVEMLTGLRAIDPNRPRGKRNLIDWVKPYLSQKRKFKHIMDSQLEGKYPANAAFQIAQVALQCLGDDPKTRPSMKEVMEILDRLQHRPPLPPKQERIQSYQLPQSACLAKFGPSGSETHVTTRVMGTSGYAAPEYAATGHLYVKSNVYCFGVVLVEMLTGLRPIDANRPDDMGGYDGEFGETGEFSNDGVKPALMSLGELALRS
ncbi:hypothetical protein Vadar_031034 [Vaccinium darrowii]|uniref:Uncharacterized protein n=1 Tax=Vaccinium darrowii TaxID=229202 RepID=A0ACB7Y3S7_9ERIC|nr:hypothetical protein Vadar_031034 [Vaccinium darrowii]